MGFILTLVVAADPEPPSPLFRKVQETNCFLTAILSLEPNAAIASSNKPSLIQRKQPSSSFTAEEVTDQAPLIFQEKGLEVEILDYWSAEKFI
jgi:hypothetical protein